MKLTRKLWWPVFVLLVAIGATTMGHAQFSSNIQGTVTDAKGAVVPDVSVTLHNTGTGVDLKATTNGDGFYRFSSVAPGNYTVNAVHTGFKESVVSVILTTGETRGANIALAVAAAGTNITVKSIAPALNPEETRIESTIPAQDISELPLANRDVQELVALTPGIVGHQNESPSNGYGSSIFAASFNPPYSANGQSTGGNLWLIDDLPVNDDVNQGSALMLPNADMIGEVALQTQTYSSENGSSASMQTSFTTKSGTNNYHGAVDYSYDGSNVGSAKDAVSGTVAEFHQDLMLVSGGGPIIKDRTFFFGSMERQLAGIGAVGSDFPYFTQQFGAWALSQFPDSGAAQALVFAPPTRDIGGQVKYASDYGIACGTTQTVPATANGPAPLTYNLPCNTPINVTNAFLNQSQPFDGIQWNVRLDQNFRQGKDRIYGMFERIDQKLGDLAERPAMDAESPSQNKYFSVNYIHLFSDKLLNEAHFGNLRTIGGLAAKDNRSLSIPYLPILLDHSAGFQFTFPFGITPFDSEVLKEHTYALRDTVTYTLNRHNIRAGYQFYRGDFFQNDAGIFTRPFVPFYSTDMFSWVSNTASAGYSLYDIGGQTGHMTPQYYGASAIYNSFFVEDTWQAKENLTITAGVRYDDYGNPEKYGSTAQPFAAMFPGTGANFQQQVWDTSTKIVSTAFTQSQNVNFLPRFGFAYMPAKNNSTAIRGGIGLYENVLTPAQIAENLPTQPPNRISLSPYGVVPYGSFQSISFPYGYNYSFPVYGVDPHGNVYSNAAQTSVFSANLNGFIPTLKPEKFLHYSLGVEQQLPYNAVLGITYAGSYGYDLVYGSDGAGGPNSDYNLIPNSPTARPTSEWGQLNYGSNGLNSNYNAMIVTLKQNYKTLSYQANYNWSKALQDAPQTNNSSSYSFWPGIYVPKTYYGPSSLDQTNTFSLGGAYEVPRTHFQSGILNEAASNWRISSIIIAQSGTPFSVTVPANVLNADKSVRFHTDYQLDGSDKFDSTNGTPGFPNFNGTKRSGFSRSKAYIHNAATGGINTLNPAQFSDPAGAGTVPVLSGQGANTFRNFGYFVVNAGAAKGFRVPFLGREEGARLILRGEAINLLNRTNWQAINNNLDQLNTPNGFGASRADFQKRYLQIGGRFEF
jgi:hypothetical protein